MKRRHTPLARHIGFAIAALFILQAWALDPGLPPCDNFDLTTWKVTLPDQTEEDVASLLAGFESPDEFYTDPVTGAMVFKCPNNGATGGSEYPRCELREMLRGTDTGPSTQGIGLNNWVFSSSTVNNQEASGGVDGVMTATLAVNYVSQTGDDYKIGRVIVGQIHAADDEPCRLYYRKLPGNTKGSIYLAHEIGATDYWYEMIGSMDDITPDPADGIALGEQFSYEIKAVGDDLWVTIMRDGKPDVEQYVDMSSSGYANDWMYFKAGCYNQNNSGDNGEYAQVSFFALDKTHNFYGNQAPSCSITSPSNGATFDEGDDVTITVDASDSEGIAKVEFYEGANKIGEDTTAPYSFTWVTPRDGSWSLTAKATDNNMAETTSTAVGITVLPGPNTAPTCSITSPTDGTAFTESADVTIQVDAADVDGIVTKVEFYEGANLLGEDTTEPFSYTWNNVQQGSYSLTAKATDDNAAETTSTAVGISVNPAVVLASEDFEAGFGEWVNVTGDTDDWIRDSGGTSSSSTGPDAGANGSTWYVYLECSGGYAENPGDYAILEGPELATGTARILSFYYHMYGVYMGMLYVDVYSGGTWNLGVWSRWGEQHSSSSEAYTKATVDLSAYTGTIKIRFRGVAIGGVQGDMAIDDIEVIGSTGANQPPAFTSDPINEIDADEDVAYSSSIADDASDPEGDPMTFSKVSGPVWLSVASNGDLSGTPGAGDVGANAFTVQVDATGGNNTATLNITVNSAPVNQPPAFTSDPINEIDADENVAYSSSIADDASDPEGDPMTFSKVSGPSWLSVASNGDLSGTPGAGDVGANAFTVQVDATGGSDTATLNITVNGSGGPVADYASSESTVSGTVSGSLADTYSNDDVYEVLTEVQSGGKPSNRHSLLEHKWTFNVTGGELVTFYVEAHHDANSEGDDFVFAYSTDDVNYTDMVTVTKTADDDTAQFYSLPGGTSGTVYIRVVDTDQSQGNSGLDSLYVDALFIISEAGSTPPTAATNPDPVNGATGVALSPTLTWTAGTLAASHDVYFGTNPNPGAGEFQGNQPGTSYVPGTLAVSTTYYWAIDEVNAAGTTAGPTWSFTTSSGANLPPAFTSDPIVEANATQDAAYSGTIADDASDPESDPMTFSKVSGPAWLSVASDGSLSGTPGAVDVGLNSFTVQVDATGGSDTATLEITVDAAGGPLPGQATDPSPAHKQRDVATTVTLSWTAGSDATSHDVYFGTVSGSPVFMGNQTGTTFDPGPLANKDTFYWRIDEVNANGTTTGTQWYFTTVR